MSSASTSEAELCCCCLQWRTGGIPELLLACCLKMHWQRVAFSKCAIDLSGVSEIITVAPPVHQFVRVCLRSCIRRGPGHHAKALRTATGAAITLRCESHCHRDSVLRHCGLGMGPVAYAGMPDYVVVMLNA
jgi:hypothetical protein